MERTAAAVVVAATLTAVGLAGCGRAQVSGPTNPGGEADAQEVMRTPQLSPPQPGSKAAAPGVPTSKEGDNSIQTYGVEASIAERTQLTALVQAYLDARAAGDWAKVCALLASRPRAEQSRFAGGVSCATAMASFAKEANPATLREESEIEVLSLRADPHYAFLIYRQPDGRVWATASTNEANRWRIISVTPALVE